MRSISRLAMVAAFGPLFVSLCTGGCSSSDDEIASATPNQGLNTGGKSGGKSGAGGADGNAGGASGNSAGGEDGSSGGASGKSAGGASGSSAGGVSGNSAGGASGNAGNGNGASGVSDTACKSDADCVEVNYPVCDASKSLCVTCVNNADCTDPERAICHENQCVECTEDAHCGAHPNGPHCAVSKRQCTCFENAECAGSSKGKLCDVDFLERCAECITSFDCKSPAAAGCSAEGTCSTANACLGDDMYEAFGDDGPSGATDISPPPVDWFETTTSAIAEGHGVCDMPFEEADWFKFTVEGPSRIVANLSWDDAKADLDLILYDATGRVYGFDYNRRPAVVTLTHLAAGTYYANVSRAVTVDKMTLNVTPYTFEVTRTIDDPCKSLTDCADDYSTQLFRGSCEASACRFINGDSKRAKGALCDSDDDCSSGFCSYTPFMHGASARSFCTEACEVETGCANNLVCSDTSYSNFCTAKCAIDEDCYAPLTHKPKGDLPWKYMHCNTNSGACE